MSYERKLWNVYEPSVRESARAALTHRIIEYKMAIEKAELHEEHCPAALGLRATIGRYELHIESLKVAIRLLDQQVDHAVPSE